jgi:hypothetical protein
VHNNHCSITHLTAALHKSLQHLTPNVYVLLQASSLVCLLSRRSAPCWRPTGNTRRCGGMGPHVNTLITCNELEGNTACAAGPNQR